MSQLAEALRAVCCVLVAEKIAKLPIAKKASHFALVDDGIEFLMPSGQRVRYLWESE